ncbi:MAG: acetyl-CoA carboxylase carboxyltransferase subunit beta [Candidatus Delongbacteria bacterium]|nr:acetyl-CoA carboxylase carboxyltransferase subunit beta [Candidatus Delongbacteria bacterium]
MNLSELFPNLFNKCKECGTSHFNKILKKNFRVCPDCGAHMPMPAQEWFTFLADQKSLEILNPLMKTKDWLEFPEYQDKIEKAQKVSRENEAVVTGIIRIGDRQVALAVLEANFMLGSMGSVVGEKITRLILYAVEMRYPLIMVSVSGGARMQEGIFSLMQMAKTSAALKKHHQAGLLYISILSNPTTGGVTASFAMLGDINIGEPGALIGFAGPRVIKQTIGKELPSGFQRAEFLLEHGMLDLVCPRKDLKNTLRRILKFHALP